MVAVMPEGEKNWGPKVIGGDNLPSLVGIGLTDLPNIGGASGPPGPPSSGTTEWYFATKIVLTYCEKNLF